MSLARQSRAARHLASDEIVLRPAETLFEDRAIRGDWRACVLSARTVYHLVRGGRMQSTASSPTSCISGSWQRASQAYSVIASRLGRRLSTAHLIMRESVVAVVESPRFDARRRALDASQLLQEVGERLAQQELAQFAR